MFNKLKHIKDLRSQAKTMQGMLANQTITVEKGGITVVMNGNMEINKITLNDDLAKNSLEGLLADAINEAIKKTQRLMAEKMQQSGGLANLGL